MIFAIESHGRVTSVVSNLTGALAPTLEGGVIAFVTCHLSALDF